jgi:hypothetical protein
LNAIGIGFEAGLVGDALVIVQQHARAAPNVQPARRFGLMVGAIPIEKPRDDPAPGDVPPMAKFKLLVFLKKL